MNKVMKMLQKYDIFSSGCHGNQNNFATYQQCRKRCSMHITQQSKKGKNIQEAKGSGRFTFLFVSDSQRMCLFIFFFFWDYRYLLFNKTIAYFFWQVWKKIKKETIVVRNWEKFFLWIRYRRPPHRPRLFPTRWGRALSRVESCLLLQHSDQTMREVRLRRLQRNRKPIPESGRLRVDVFRR